MIFGQGLASSRVEDVAASLASVDMIFGRGLVSSHVEDVAASLGSVDMIFGQGLVSSCVVDVARREASLGSVDMCIISLGKGLFLHMWKMLRLVWVL